MEKFTMKVDVVTTFNQNGYEVYGKTMVETFDKHWPKDVVLHVYTEGFDLDSFSERVIEHKLENSLDLMAFKERWKNDPVAHGKIQGIEGGLKRPTKFVHPKHSKHANVDSFLYDAVRFSHKVMSIREASKITNADFLVWLDGDTKTFADVPHKMLGKVCDVNCMLSYLGRDNKYSECGFVVYNLKHPKIKEFLTDFAALYTHDRIFNELEWHDSYLFDVLRKKYENQGVVTKNISGKGSKTGHPFVNSILGNYIDHLKGGNRKKLGKSFKDDIKIKHETNYWQN
jgi:hypothetical protein